MGLTAQPYSSQPMHRLHNLRRKSSNGCAIQATARIPVPPGFSDCRNVMCWPRLGGTLDDFYGSLRASGCATCGLPFAVGRASSPTCLHGRHRCHLRSPPSRW